jgi:hypothetical protein
VLASDLQEHLKQDSRYGATTIKITKLPSANKLSA